MRMSLSFIVTKKKTFLLWFHRRKNILQLWNDRIFILGLTIPSSIYPCSPYFISSFRKGRSGDCFETCTTFPSCFVILHCFFSQFFHDVGQVSHSPLCFTPDSTVIPHFSLSPYAFDDTGQHSREKKLACASVLVFYKASIYISKYKHRAHEFLQWKH